MNAFTASASSGPRRFPAGFLWGASTSAYQIEGAVDEDGRGRSIWDVFSHAPGKRARRRHRRHRLRLLPPHRGGPASCSASSASAPTASRSPGRACSRAGAARSTRRPRLLPPLIDGLRRRGIMPVATLYHWELPQALEDARRLGQPRHGRALRASTRRSSPSAFGDRVGMWITLNEPPVGPPGLPRRHPRSRPRDAASPPPRPTTAARPRSRARRRCASRPQARRVGIALDPTRSAPSTTAPRRPRPQLDAEHNRMYLDPVLHGVYRAGRVAELLPPDAADRRGDLELIGAPLDFLGINYYRTHYVRQGDWSDLRLGEDAGARLSRVWSATCHRRCHARSWTG